MDKIRLIVNNYQRFSKFQSHLNYDFDCINTNLSKLQEFVTGYKRTNWNDGNKVQWNRLIATGKVELISLEQMYSIEDEFDKFPTFFLVTIPEIGGMFDTNWLYWLTENTKNFLKSTGIPILLSQPGEFGFEWLESNDKFAWTSHVFVYFMNKLRAEGLANQIVIHNMSKIYMDLTAGDLNCESVYSRQWIEHVKINDNLTSGTISYDQHVQNINNKRLYFSSNRAPREARCLLLLNLLKNNHLDKGHLSFLCEAPATVKLSTDQIKAYFDSLKHFLKFYSVAENYVDYCDSAMSLLPIELDTNINDRNNHVILNNNINHYRLNSLFEIVVETHDFTRDAVQAGVLSEKAFWPILNQMPFILIGHRRNVDLLHELGFETFEPEFGLTHSTTANIVEQVEGTNRVLNNFSNYSNEERLSWFTSDAVKRKILHNYNHLINTDWNSNEIGSLADTFRKIMCNQKTTSSQ